MNENLSNIVSFLNIQNSNIHCGYEAKKYQGEFILYYQPEDYLNFIKLEIKELIFQLKHQGIKHTLDNLIVKINNNLSLQFSLENHLINIGQYLRDYGNFFDDRNPYFDQKLNDIDEYFESFEKEITVIKNARGRLIHEDDSNDANEILKTILLACQNLEGVYHYSDLMLAKLIGYHKLNEWQKIFKREFSSYVIHLVDNSARLVHSNQESYWENIWNSVAITVDSIKENEESIALAMSAEHDEEILSAADKLKHKWEAEPSKNWDKLDEHLSQDSTELQSRLATKRKLSSDEENKEEGTEKTEKNKKKRDNEDIRSFSP